MTEAMYKDLGVSPQVFQYGKEIEGTLAERFEQIDKIAEYNQLKVIKAMQRHRVSEACFAATSGYGYNDPP